MHSSNYKVSDSVKYVVHYNGDCVGEAIFTIVENYQVIYEVEADIHDIQVNVLMAQLFNASSIRIGTSDFSLSGIVSILSSLVIMRIVNAVESTEISLGDLVEFEESINGF